MRQSRRGFTLVEILVVLGIILVLVGLLVTGFRHVSKAAAGNNTKAILHVARGMLTEYEKNNGIGFMPAGPWGAPGGDMSDQAAASIRYTTGVVTLTQGFMKTLEQIPANRNVISSMQPKQLLETPSGSPPDMDTKGAVLLDGWRNPIILVPAGGLQVNISDTSVSPAVNVLYVVRTSGTYVKATAPAVGKADRPFFASAGQDGDFSRGEDNLYSFQD